MPIETVLNRLDKVKSNGNNKWLACCPAHQDRSPSLSVWEPEPDKILFHCFAGCELPDILAAISLEMADIFPERDAISVHRDRPDYYARLHRKEVHSNDLDQATLSIYLQDIKAGKKFTPKENEHYRNLYLKVNKTKGGL